MYAKNARTKSEWNGWAVAEDPYNNVIIKIAAAPGQRFKAESGDQK